MNKDLVNKKNTREWIKCNDDAKSFIWRDSFVEEHGGQFIQEGRNWRWEEQKIIADNRIKQERKEFIFINSDGVEFLTDNFTKFCRKNDLNKSAMYKVMSGERTHHKGFTCKKLPPKGE
jgi:hypothetical protein